MYLFAASPLSPALRPPELPLLAGEPALGPFERAQPMGRRGAFELYQDGPWWLGRAELVAGDALEAVAEGLYREAFELTAGRNLCRFWNHVPGINRRVSAGLEAYRAFCRGRSRAFEAACGAGFHARIPAATAVGTDGPALAVAFAACEAAPRHVENPEQVPAYRYPREHGPRPPSFARATVVPAPGRADVFVSGTAAVVGHTSVAPGDTAGQLAPTLRNLGLVSAACGAGADLARGGCAARWFRVYLRHARDLHAVQEALGAALLAPGDRVSYLRADICRAELNLEIEATLLGVRARLAADRGMRT